MKHFFKYIFIRILLILTLLYLLDVIFTAIYIKNTVIRNKIQFVFKNKFKNFDNVFLGSSRVEFHVNTSLLDSLIHQKSLNLGISGQDLSETFLTLQLLIKNGYQIKKYFIQIDESDLATSNKKSFIGASYFMPYIYNKAIKQHLKTYDYDFYLDYYIPFYKYINYGPKIGYRELLLTLAKKKRTEEFYIGLHQFIKNKDDTYLFKNTYNAQLIDNIKQFARKNNIDVTFFTTPYYHPKNTDNYNSFAKSNHIASYVDSLQSSTNFKDLTHLNYIGARKFTKLLIRDFNLTKN